MKIVLRAFGKLRSDIIEVPEEIQDTASYQLSYPYDNRPTLMKETDPPFRLGEPSLLHAEFRWNGFYQFDKNEGYIKIFELVDIWKEKSIKRRKENE